MLFVVYLILSFKIETLIGKASCGLRIENVHIFLTSYDIVTTNKMVNNVLKVDRL